MMSDSDEQTVDGKTDVAASPATEESNDAQDLDSLLAEFDSADTGTPSGEVNAKTNESSEQGGQPDDIKDVVNYVRGQQERDKAEQERKIQEQTDNAINDAVKTLKEEVPLPDKLLRGIIYAKSDDARFVKAFQNRNENPEAWNKILKAVAKETNAELQQESTDPELSKDRNALLTAVHNASSAASVGDGNVSFSDLSDAQLDEMKRKIDREAASR